MKLTSASEEATTASEQLAEKVLWVHTATHSTTAFETSFASLVIDGSLVGVREDFVASESAY